MKKRIRFVILLALVLLTFVLLVLVLLVLLVLVPIGIPEFAERVGEMLVRLAKMLNGWGI